MAPGHRGSEIDPTTTFQQVERQVVSLTTLATNQTTANPDLPDSEDYQFALEIATPDSSAEPRYHERMIENLLAMPGYPQALEGLYRDRDGLVLFGDVANARRSLDDASSPVNPFDGLREDDGYLLGRLDDALEALAHALSQRWASDLTTALIKAKRAERQAERRLVAA